MRLKRVKIFGFKTFADKAEFDVDGDLIAVVGPNGCGKSNLVDAILWGLGEGSARQLRAQTGADVIFNGSARRKPVGYAEVTLLFDNEDGSLPVPTTEVAITRRMTRSGESEYSINRQACRLRDVLELLADSGLGRAGYAIVGQKEIDQALAASPEDRRAWVDEAAGVQRYRARKAESQRRLASAREHLARVNDIVREIESQREPLREEAEIAARYKAAQTALREVESGLLIVETAQAVAEAEDLQRRAAEAMKHVDAETALAQESERRQAEIGREISALESEMDSLRASQQGALTQVERADAALRLGRQRLESLDELEASLGEEEGRSRQRIAELERDLEAQEAETRLEAEALARLTEECAGAGEDAQRLRAELEAAERAVEAAREARSRYLREQAESVHRSARRAEVARELAGIEEALPGLRQAEASARADLEVAVRAHEDAQRRVLELDERDAAERRAAEEAYRELRPLLAERAALEGRRQGIAATLAAHEGLAPGARAVLEAVESGRLPGPCQAVGEAVSAPREWATAIEAALGARAHDLLVPDRDAALAGLAYLAADGAGRATFHPVSSFPAAERPEAPAALGIVGWAAEVADCSPDLRPAVDALLQGVLLAETLEDALRLKTGDWKRIATRDGQVVHRSGALSGGSSNLAAGPLQRRTEQAETEARCAELDERIAACEAAATAREEAADLRLAEMADARAQAAETETAAAEARKWLASVHDELRSTDREANRLRAEAEGLATDPSPSAAEVDWEEAERARDELWKVVAARSADAEHAENRLREARQRTSAAEERLATARRRLQASRETEAQRARRYLGLGAERDRARMEIQAAESERQSAAGRLEEAVARLAQAGEKRQTLLEKSFELSEAVKRAHAAAQEAIERVHRAELARTRADAKRANAAQKLMEEYGIGEDDAVAQAPEIVLPADAAQAAARLRRELKAMGDVNLGAIEAYRRLTERAEELSLQKTDIEGGIAEVEAGIRELDHLTRDRFVSTFEAVRVAFSELFARLFPGGEADLRLSVPDAVLESGIEIDATLPGKKRQRLELLSGGERSLCAASFLFSLLRVKPSPLVVLDEVDAPLDGRNVERFIELLREFSGTIQFVVITHNPSTIEAAPVWLGVTMGEPGVSTLAPVRIRSSAPPALLA